MSDVRREPPARSVEGIQMQADAQGRASVYQAGQSITINQYGGDSKVRQAAVVMPISSDADSRATLLRGRNQSRAALLTLLKPLRTISAGTVVSVISGLAGVGKTALTRHVASVAIGRGWFTAAVFTDLHGYDPDPQDRVAPAQLFSSLLRALGVSADRIPTSISEQAASYHQFLASMANLDHRILLVFDNVSNPVQINELLPDARIHRVLITSRHTLGELDNVALLELDTLRQDEAVAVLREILRQRNPADLRISRRPEEAEKLARLCGYLPLALRITGALLAEDPTLPVADLVEDLADTRTRLDGLVYGERAVSAAFDLSWLHLLERDEQAAQLFLRLPINPGPEISSEAAAALGDCPPRLTRRLLRVLRRGHLIEPGTSAGRWRMHDLLQLYADGIRRLQDSSDYPASVNRLLRYYLTTTDAANYQVQDLPKHAESRLFTSRDDALAWLDVERPNLTGAVLLAVEVGYQDLAVDLSLALSTFLRLRRHFDDYVVIAAAGVRAAGLLGDARREAMAVSNLGLAPQEARLMDEVLASHRQRSVMYQKSGDRNGEGWALANLGAALWAMGRFEDVIDATEQAARVFGELGDGPREAWSLTMLGLALQKTGQTERAIDSHKRACAIFRHAMDRNGEAWSLTNLGASLRVAMRFDEAIDVGNRANAIFRETDDRTGVGATLVNIGIAFGGLGRYNEAVQMLKQACKIFQEVGDRQREATALNKLGVALRDLGRFDEGIEAHKQAHATFQGVGDRYGEASSLTELGVALLEASLIPEARRHWERAVELFQAIGASGDAERVRSMIEKGDDDSGSLG